MSTEQIEQLVKRTQVEYSRIAGEPVEAQQIGSAIYVFGSELATLRLFRKMPNKRQGYSANLERFYFTFDIPF
ncbi:MULTISPECIES: hypothetical protein [Ectopseudomonas]|jgi:hypothetical protein|uniref:Uncharacterized protein n=2 Tax=Ectopseudomonas TaxID=3236654 RepID=A0A1G6PS28_9GAMM|nr:MULTISPECIES: hypothetical protein [Pseudomonas]ALN21938.1 hypothetical protein DW68_024995 [Pseudomonas mendocina S5.2]KER98009.1 hypothetical protein HN51_24700 [Pseudomonas mendocina]MBP3061905.1 hypothetical protein [Pseudomonas chengduensis]NNB75197.1 hypothetical protein [Pseudomonas chengduensis]OEO24563.1 hypothetical protein AX279_18025 [Pseudomonas sp. J237]